MGTAGKLQGWSVVVERRCPHDCPACHAEEAERDALRSALIEAQEALFDEPARMTGIEQPLVTDRAFAA